MTKKSYSAIRRVLVAILCVLFILSMSGCGREDPPGGATSIGQQENSGNTEGDATSIDQQENSGNPEGDAASADQQENSGNPEGDAVSADQQENSGDPEGDAASADQQENNGNAEKDTADDHEKQFVETYPRTHSGFTYNSLYNGTLDPKGKLRLMIIPVEIEGGDPMDEAFFTRLKEMMEGPLESDYFFNVKQYYRNASYGQFDFEYDVMPVYKLDLTMDQWVNGNREKRFKYSIYEREAITYAIDHYVSDPGIYDSDGDGYLDGIVCITNEPSSVETASGCIILTNDDVAAYPENVRMRFFLDTQVHCFDTSSRDYRNNVFAHELAHYFGIDDYYDYRGINSSITNFDLQSGTYGDWNPFSKFSVGWIDPYVITPDVEKVTITLRNSAEYPDAILIPCGEWNGTPFDEYLLVDVFADRGNNKLPFYLYYMFDSENDASEDCGGVRVFHVDARLKRRAHYSGESLGWFSDFSGSERYTKNDVRTAYSNTTVTKETMDDAPDRNPDYRMLSLIPASRDKIEPGYAFYSSYLFHGGDVFTMEKYSRFFPNYPLTNKHGSLEYRLTVKSYDDKTKEAVIEIEKIQ